MKIIKALIVVVILSATVWALPPQIEADKLAVGAKASLEVGDFKSALEKLDKLKSLNVRLPDNYWYYYGSTLLSLENANRAIGAFDKYLEQGQKVKYYKETLELYNLAEREVKDNMPTLDEDTGYMWQDSVHITHKKWNEAQFYCKDRAFGGFSDWRLPSKEMLESLYKKLYILKDPGLGYNYWTISESNKPGVLSFNYNFIFSDHDDVKNSDSWIRCVRIHTKKK